MKGKALSVVLGVITIACGLFICAQALGITDFNISTAGWWAIFIVLPCIISMYIVGINLVNAAGFVIGVLCYLNEQSIIPGNMVYKLMVPAIIIGLGLFMLFKRPIKGSRDGNSGIFAGSNGDNHFAIFGYNAPQFIGVNVRSAYALAVFGGVVFNLENANIGRDCVIKTYSIFGGTDIFLPKDMKTVIKSLPIIGAVENTYIPSSQQFAPTVYIHCLSVFGRTIIS